MKPCLLSVTAVYTQEPDGDDPHRSSDQELTLQMTRCGAGPYLIVSTDRWAIDRPRDLHRLVKQFAAQVEALFDRDQGV